MQIQMTPAVCALNASKRKQSQCLEGYLLTITGLLPETTTNTSCETSSSSVLSPLQAKVVAKVMPGENSRAQLWRSIGGCVPMSASQYFRLIINFAERLKIPIDLTSGSSKKVQKVELLQQFVRLNPALPNNAIRLGCQSTRANPILTEVHVCYQSNGAYKQCSHQVAFECPDQFMIQGSY